MQWKTAALVATMAAGAMLSCGAPVSAATTLVANADAGHRPPETARTDWASTPAAAGSDLFVAPGPGSGASASTTSANYGADPFDDALSQALSATPGQTPATSFGPPVWVLLILGVALIGFAARHAGTRTFATDERAWGRSSARRYSRNFSIFNYYTHDD